MRPSVVEVLDIGMKYAVELLLMQDEHVIKALSTHTSKKPFTDGIRAPSLIRCSEHLDVTCFRNPPEAHPKLAIVLTDEVLRPHTKGGGFPNRYVQSKRQWEIVSRRRGSLCASAVR